MENDIQSSKGGESNDKLNIINKNLFPPFNTMI